MADASANPSSAPPEIERLTQKLAERFESDAPASFLYRAQAVEASVRSLAPGAVTQTQDLLETMRQTLTPRHGAVLRASILLGRALFESDYREASLPLLQDALNYFEQSATVRPPLADELESMIAAISNAT